MSFLPHTITGAVVGAFMPHPIASFLGGFASHLVLDFIPHYDPELSSKNGKPKSKAIKIYYTSVISVDFLCSVAILLFLIPFPSMFFGALGGILPDIDNFLQWRFKQFPLLSKIGIPVHDLSGTWMHNQLKFHPTINFLLGVLMQSMICLGGLYFLFLKIFT
jgi:hypothetical protein